jgi:hypothetical protein
MSPLATAQLFLQVLQSRSKEISNLISSHLGDSILTNSAVTTAALSGQASEGKVVSASATTTSIALPLGGRIKVDLLNDQLHLLKSKPAGMVAENEKKQFEVTPVILYLTRQKCRSTDNRLPRTVSVLRSADFPAARWTAQEVELHESTYREWSG